MAKLATDAKAPLDAAQGSHPHARQAARPTRASRRSWQLGDAEEPADASTCIAGARRTAAERPQAARRIRTRRWRRCKLAITLDERRRRNLRRRRSRALAGNRGRHASGCSTRTPRSELPKELVAEAGRLLRNSPVSRICATRRCSLFPAPGKLNPKKLPAIAELAKRSGDAARGKAGVERQRQAAQRSARSATRSAASAGRSGPICR